ncbi:XRE family transcriptional regulator [Caulobacter radicis]|uniref:helix-turn-helix domain-containing protein n=1 Tax=Caulobacter radicis TaxID=2172650 RepID=UPI000D563558|nr:helix-turn-helix transcriptional regulator [Caulobacter radicis]PVM91761.1 XRE family transcriptional regulator [Caulobacter radicis]
MASSIFDETHRRMTALLVSVRRGAGVTQAELARRVGRSQSLISLVERNQRRVDVIEFVALCRALDQDPEQMFERLVQFDEAAQS